MGAIPERGARNDARDGRPHVARIARLFASPETIVIVSRLRDPRIVDVNRAFETSIGIPRGEAVASRAFAISGLLAVRQPLQK